MSFERVNDTDYLTKPESNDSLFSALNGSTEDEGKTALLRWEEETDYYLTTEVLVYEDKEGYVDSVIDKETGKDLTRLSKEPVAELIFDY